MGPTLILRVLVVLVVLRVLGQLVRGLLQGLRETAAPGSGREMVRDRICNTFLPRERALMAVVGGVEEPFCSAACRDRALAPQPAR
jgi:hypothetical protein